MNLTVRRVLHTHTGWSVEADLTFNGEVVRSYPAYDLLLLDLNELELRVLARNRTGITVDDLCPVQPKLYRD